MTTRVLVALALVLAAGAASAIPPPDLAGDVSGLRTHVLAAGMAAHRCVTRERQGVKPLLALIDYTLPSTARRLWVIDLDQRRVLWRELVAHGKNSGDDQAVWLSDQPGSKRSSLGVFLTDQPYVGRRGYSLRLNGLEPGFNGRARARRIVLHGAPYVGDDVIAKDGILGKSWGCPAVRPEVARELIDALRGRAVVVMYANDRRWLQTSRYLRCGD